MYSERICRSNPACILFLVDQSAHMGKPCSGDKIRRCDVAAEMINQFVWRLIMKASGSFGIRDWYEVGVFGYRTDGDGTPKITSALRGPLAEQAFVPISKFDAHPQRVEERFFEVWDNELASMVSLPLSIPIWIDHLEAEGGAPVCHMLYHAFYLLETWINEHSHSFPPMVFNFIGCEYFDGDPLPYADSIKSLATSDGNVLLFNCVLSNADRSSFFCPHDADVFLDVFTRAAFNMSSILPAEWVKRGECEGIALQHNARGMFYNADIASIINCLR